MRRLRRGGVMGSDELEDFLRRHRAILSEGRFSAGARFGVWEVRAFIGHGGSGEVYRVVCEAAGEELAEGALKVFVKPGQERRFGREVALLRALSGAAFPRLLDAGETEGWLWHVTELLEQREVAPRDRAVADFILGVARGVEVLHGRGWVHRDLKLQNILFRGAQPVILDFGLAEHPGTPTAQAAGTPHTAAPEQFFGGEITAALDIHALGVVVNDCFHGWPPRVWERIISRATSSIPERRFRDVADFIAGVRRRNWGRRVRQGVVGLGLLAGLVGASWWAWCRWGREWQAWRRLQTGEVAQVVRERVEMVTDPKLVFEDPKAMRFRVDREVHEAQLIRLNPKEPLRLEQPLHFKPGIYKIEGPGRLEAALEGEEGAEVWLSKCVVMNRTTRTPPENKLRFVLEKGSYLNFSHLKETPELRELVEIPDSYSVYLRFGGPESVQALYDEISNEWYRSLRE